MFAMIFMNISLVVLTEYIRDINDYCDHDSLMYKYVIEYIGTWLGPLNVAMWGVNLLIIIFWFLYFCCCARN